MYCAGWKNGKGNGICFGDSGGPLVCFKNDHLKLFGIASFTCKPCGEKPSVFGRVKSIRKWIKKVTGIIPTIHNKI